MTTRNDLDVYFEACRAAFRERPETHRIELYATHASGDRENPVHIYRLAEACLHGGSLPLWRHGVDLALTLPHDTTRSADERREVLRRLGDWNAWQDVEWPTKPEDLPPVVDRWWDGVEDLSGKTLLVCDLGAHGTAIRWLRFADALSDRISAPTHWVVSTNLMEFVGYNFRRWPHVHTFDFERAWDPERTEAHFDRALNANLLPRLVGSLPPFVRRVAPEPVTLPERRDQARIGLVWACSDGFDHLSRSAPLGVLMPFFWRSDVEFYSLQIGVRAQEARVYPRLRLPDPPLESFADTANLIASLDGVVTVDTSVAHLSASLGVPTLTLLSFPGDILWGFADTTPWYPTMRFIRQRRPWDWLSVQAQLNEALKSRWWEELRAREPAVMGAPTNANLEQSSRPQARPPNHLGFAV